MVYVCNGLRARSSNNNVIITFYLLFLLAVRSSYSTCTSTRSSMGFIATHTHSTLKTQTRHGDNLPFSGGNGMKKSQNLNPPRDHGIAFRTFRVKNTITIVCHHESAIVEGNAQFSFSPHIRFSLYLSFFDKQIFLFSSLRHDITF